MWTWCVALAARGAHGYMMVRWWPVHADIVVNVVRNGVSPAALSPSFTPHLSPVTLHQPTHCATPLGARPLPHPRPIGIGCGVALGYY